MSKVDDLKKRYPKIRESTFNAFVAADNTLTKKYLPYLLDMWSQKNTMPSNAAMTSALLIHEVGRYNRLLPHHTNKDIYSSEFKSFALLKIRNDEAEERKQDSLFIREDHVNVIIETGEILMVEPKTIEGSLKYGAKTRWCTASKSAPHTFYDYKNRGCLVYLIDKTESKATNYSKLALFCEGFPLTGEIKIFNANDNHISEHTVIKNGWEYKDLTEALLRFRLHYIEWVSLKESRDVVSGVTSKLKSIDFDVFSRHLEVLKSATGKEFDDAKKVVDDFLVGMNEMKKNVKFLA